MIKFILAFLMIGAPAFAAPVVVKGGGAAAGSGKTVSVAKMPAISRAAAPVMKLSNPKAAPKVLSGIKTTAKARSAAPVIKASSGPILSKSAGVIAPSGGGASPNSSSPGTARAAYSITSDPDYQTLLQNYKDLQGDIEALGISIAANYAFENDPTVDSTKLITSGGVAGALTNYIRKPSGSGAVGQCLSVASNGDMVWADCNAAAGNNGANELSGGSNNDPNKAITSLSLQNGTITATVGGPFVTADGYVAKSGGTMTGTLTLSGHPKEPRQVATKYYVDSIIKGGSESYMINRPDRWPSGTSSPTEISFGNGLYGSRRKSTFSITNGVGTAIVASSSQPISVLSAGGYVSCNGVKRLVPYRVSNTDAAFIVGSSTNVQLSVNCSAGGNFDIWLLYSK